MTSNQKEALRRIFCLYSVVKNQRSLSYRLVDQIPDLILAFPNIALELDGNVVHTFRNIIKKNLNKKGGKPK